MRAVPSGRVECHVLRADEGPRCSEVDADEFQRVTPDARAKEKFLLVDPVGVLRYELGLDTELRPYRSKVEENLANWLARQEQEGARFTGDQVWWLNRIAVTLANRLCVTPDDLDGVPFTERGGVDGFIRDFGDERAEQLLDELNRTLPA